MKNKYILALALITLSPCANASDTKNITPLTPVLRHNEITKTNHRDNLMVYVDNSGDYYIHCGRASVYMKHSTLGALIASMQKAIEWSSKSRAAKISTMKDLPQVAGLDAIVFQSLDGGEDCRIGLMGIDFDNQFIKLMVDIKSSDIPAFIEALSKVDETTQTLRNENNRASDVLR